MSFKPQYNEEYWMINSRFEVVRAISNNSAKSNARISVGNSFKSQRTAVHIQSMIKEQIKKRWWQIWP